MYNSMGLSKDIVEEIVGIVQHSDFTHHWVARAEMLVDLKLCPIRTALIGMLGEYEDKDPLCFGKDYDGLLDLLITGADIKRAKAAVKLMSVGES